MEPMLHQWQASAVLVLRSFFCFSFYTILWLLFFYFLYYFSFFLPENFSVLFSSKKIFFFKFLSRVTTLTRDIDIAILSVCPSVRDVPVLDENGLTLLS